jgi:signal peptidase II
MKKILHSSLDQFWIHFAPLGLALLAADQISKAWALERLANVNLAPIVGFQLSLNHGIAFGIAVPPIFSALLTVFILGFGGYLVVKNQLWRDAWHRTGLALLLAGALGNLIDRLRFGYVVDFIKVYFWPNFNLADVFIVLAVVLFSWEFIVREKQIQEI